ncbi:MAG: DUF4136 domain-containing protein [Pseudomonadales bacterium]|nr:DUF4136 domain-containing protein [Pseudomonadales bacterium]MBO6563533.1 DUF4136 domain-containing protein [Pseudomonadales bacterium]MBO6596847.1 DUF4136 domain-containing protein [Pseudomonadales bacterium]MBO6703518.1 DUF4136 domain-containing protein [Pseudomonadales bacterium]MBO6823164.1 DUF4136 domain-containing protein [Pseudomonadales bacterium]
MRLLALLVTITFLLGCSAPAPRVDFDPSYDFSNDKTFAFISDNPVIRGEGAEGGNPLTEGRLMQITENLMAARGFTRIADRDNADLAVGFTLGARDKIQVNSYPEPYRYGYGRWGWGGGYYYGDSVDVRQYTEGTLSVDIYDPQERKPVWHAVATRKITSKMQENPGVALEQILTEMFATFPPPQ